MDTQLHTFEFPPSKLALIAPDVSLQRYMEIGLRPSLRKFTEFRPVVISQAGLSRYEKEGTSGGNILGSSIAKSGATNVICNISAGIIEDSQELTNDYRLRLDKDIIEAVEQEYGEREQEGEGKGDNASAYASVYTVVEVSKGRNGPPTAEEIELSQSLYETILHSGLIPQDSLKIKLGLKSEDENGNPVILREEDELLSELKPKKSFRFVLYAKIQVYSKTGPLFDLCYGSLLEALKNTRLPEMYIGEKESEAEIKLNRNKRNGSNGADVEDYDLICDSTAAHNLQLNQNRLS
ncbi:DEKNAAC101883, partial [Brettanomyces naardenensis]